MGTARYLSSQSHLVPASAQGVYTHLRGGLAHGQATITVAATLRAANSARRSITIKALSGGGTLYVGTAGVLTTTGYEVLSGESLTLGRCTEAILVIASASTDVRFVEELA